MADRPRPHIVLIGAPIVGAIIAVVLSVKNIGGDARALIVVGIAVLAAFILVAWSGIANRP